MKVIHIFGASGAGTSTLGTAIFNKYGYKHMDTDDYFWCATNPPFTTKREPSERIMIMEKDIKIHEKVVITGSLCGWGDVLIPLFDLVIRVVTPTENRIKRLKEREYFRFGNRILVGGDMHEEHLSFIEWAKEYDYGDENMRSKAMHDRWSKLIECESVLIDGVKPVEDNIELLNQYFNF